jgi:PPOX class probable F420-dependent enzyme
VTDLSDFAGLVAREHGLCVLSTVRADGTIQSSVVNAGVLEHPVTGRPAVGFVVRGATRKLTNLRLRPHATVVVRVGWQWVTAEGQVELAGPEDALPGLAADAVPPLLRAVFSAAGGEHEDWETYDRVMAEEHRTVVLLTPARVYSNP